jgi:hypothetical protein
MTEPIDIKHIGKLGEEICESGAAIFRCIIQGIDEREPETGKLNREWLEDELADVTANMELVAVHFGLDIERMNARSEKKKLRLYRWHQDLKHIRSETVLLVESKKKRSRFGYFILKNVFWLLVVVPVIIYLVVMFLWWKFK